jgi:hypothetical protein
MKNSSLRLLGSLLTLAILAIVAVQYMAIQARMDGAVLKSTVGALAGISTVLTINTYRAFRDRKRGVKGNGIHHE